MATDRLVLLFDRYISGGLTLAEELEFSGLVLDPGNAGAVDDLVSGYWASVDADSDIPDPDQLFQRIIRGRVIPMRSRRRRWWMAAAVAALLVGIGGYLLLLRNGGQPKPVVVATITPDITAPTASRATLILANGQRVFLDSAATGTLATQGQVSIKKLGNGQIQYSGATGELAYNTLYNPRGSQVINITLGDGTRVWLNAASSLRYPVAFGGGERLVDVNGEAYFEVARDPGKPFMVSKNGMSVKVLGTHFNVNAYDDEAAIRVTLLEGLVEVTGQTQHQTVSLRPGEQAVLAGNLSIAQNVDLDQVMAWKNGEFQFNEKTDIHTIMRQLSRWYDIDIVYQGTVTGHFWGSISRSVQVSEVLAMLQKTGAVHFTLEGRRVTVAP